MFANFLSEVGLTDSGKVDFWPEDHAHGEIDAIVGQYAIQHTSLDALPDGRERDVWFKRIIGNLESEFAGKLGFRLAITIDWDSVQKGQAWHAIQEAIRNWINGRARSLQEGHHKIADIPGIPFRLHVTKGGLRSDGVYFARFDPGDQTLARRLRDQIKGASHDKLTALARHRADERITVLLLESGDFALLDAQQLCEAFQAAFTTWPLEIHELWFVHRLQNSAVNIYDLCRGLGWIFDDAARRVLGQFSDTARVQAEIQS
jgi:hypothetical protein